MTNRETYILSSLVTAAEPVDDYEKANLPRNHQWFFFANEDGIAFFLGHLEMERGLQTQMALLRQRKKNDSTNRAHYAPKTVRFGINEMVYAGAGYDSSKENRTNFKKLNLTDRGRFIFSP